MSRKIKLFFLISIGISFFWMACITNGNSSPEKSLIVDEPQKMDQYVSSGIKELLDFTSTHQHVLDKYSFFSQDSLVQVFYKKRGYLPFWSFEGQSHPIADSLVHEIQQCRYLGLFPSDLNVLALDSLQSLLNRDPLSKKDAMLWAKRDLLLTNGFFHLAHDLKLGRLERDSITLSKDSSLHLDFLENLLTQMKDSMNVRLVLKKLEPLHPGYDSLKIGLKYFLDSADFPNDSVTYIHYRSTDSLVWVLQTGKRLLELGLVDSSFSIKDTGAYKKALRLFQKEKGLKVTGRLDGKTADLLNMTTEQKFRIVALNLDRYKHLPDTMPLRYLWVNIPSYYLQVWENDSLAFISRVVVGKPDTRTPMLTSRLTEIITYPQWNIPSSIVLKEVVPGVRKKADYLAKHNYIIVDQRGQVIDPSTLTWSKYKKTFPYKIVQGSGDDNALGILKFNFTNKYSVYMHDTNQRYLFGNPKRSMSHGCVRVQEWEKLAYFLLKGDTLKTRRKLDSVPVNPSIDSLKAWLKRKEKHYLPIRTKMHVFIRYFTSDVKGGKIRFFEDIYEEDRSLLEKYYLRRRIN